MPSFFSRKTAPIDSSNAGVVHLNDSRYYPDEPADPAEPAFTKPSDDQLSLRKTLSAAIDRYVTNESASDDSSSSKSSRSRAHPHPSSSQTSLPSEAAAAATAAIMAPMFGSRSGKSPMSSGVNGVTEVDANKTGYFENLRASTERPFPASTPADANGPTANGRLSSSSSKRAYLSTASMSNPQIERSDHPSSGRTSLQQTPADMSAQPNGDVSAADALQHQAVAPQRYSSPAHYGGSSSTPSLQAAPPNALRQRHTLEVPRPQQQSNRASTSRDTSTDAAFASGRFSPTVGSGGRRASLSLGRRNTRSIHSEMHRDEVLPDDDAARWTEAYRQKRARRKKREEEDDDKVLVGTKVDESHANWETAYNMLTGIRVSVSRTNAKLDRPLTDADFDAKQKSTFDM